VRFYFLLTPGNLANACHKLTFRECGLGLAEFYGGLVSPRGWGEIES
jgi:hypothetical protein